MSLTELKRRIEGLRPGMTAEEAERVKRELLSAVETMEAKAFTIGDAEGAHARLSRREQEVMSMMLEGQRLKEIAARLDISVKTVTTHRSRLMKKLRVDDNLGLYRYGIRNGLISV